MMPLPLVIAGCLALAPVAAPPNPWAGFYDRATLDTWGERVIPGIKTTLRDDLLPRVPPEFQSQLRGVVLRFPPELPNDAMNFFSHWDAREKVIVMPVSSMRLFRDLCVAEAWLSRKGYSLETVSDYLTMLRAQWPSASLRSGEHTPLEVLGVPADAMEDAGVERMATALFGSGITFLMGHELGHIAHRHPEYKDITWAQARSNEAEADEFGLELMKQLGVAPLGAMIFFTSAAHLELDAMSPKEAQRRRTHPLNAERIRKVASWVEGNAGAFSRSAEHPIRARAEIDTFAVALTQIADALEIEGANVLLELRGLTARVDGLKPRRPGAPRLARGHGKIKPARPWDGVFEGHWTSAHGEIPTEMQLVPTDRGANGVYVFGAGMVQLEGDVEGRELHYNWTLDDVNRGTGVLRLSAAGNEITGTWKRTTDGYEASWNLHWVGESVKPPPTPPILEPRAASAGSAGIGLGLGAQTTTDAPKKKASRLKVGWVLIQLNLTSGYQALRGLLEKNEDVLASDRAVETMEQRVLDPTLDENARALAQVHLLTCLDCRQYGADIALKRLSVRLIAIQALSAANALELAAFLTRFNELAPEMSAQLVHAALDTPGNRWPQALLPLMDQLAQDWPQLGAVAAAQRMAEAASRLTRASQGGGSEPRGGAVAEDAQPLVGHWRAEEIVYERARDENLVLQPDGTVTNWVARAEGNGNQQGGRWRAQGGTLTVTWEDGRESSFPYFFHEGQLVWPNIEGRRRFWVRIR